MKVTLLGVGGSAGLPQIGGPDGYGDWGVADPKEPRNRRMRASIAIHTDNGAVLLVDTGPDMRQQLVENGIGRVDCVLFTHAHADHIGGLDDIRILNRLQDAPMPIYGSVEALDEIAERFNYAFKPWTGGFFGRPVLIPHIITPGQAFKACGVEILPIDQDHGYSRSLGFRIGEFAYCTDVVRLDETALCALKGVKTWIIDCFTPDSDHPTHAGLETVQDWVRLLQPQRTILTHMGPMMDYRTLLSTLPAGTEPGYDGMSLDI